MQTVKNFRGFCHKGAKRPAIIHTFFQFLYHAYKAVLFTKSFTKFTYRRTYTGKRKCRKSKTIYRLRLSAIYFVKQKRIPTTKNQAWLWSIIWKDGSKSNSYLGPKIWNIFPASIKLFKKLINKWIPQICPCKSYITGVGFLSKCFLLLFILMASHTDSYLLKLRVMGFCRF